ncbi:MAG: hypothetical protein ABSG04_05640 [Verrucomicrobiota bacterium]|jgi:hypothetical protein
MSALRIEISQGRTAFEPGEELTGTVGWKLDKPARAVELRLFWFTGGAGAADAGVVETAQFDHPSPDDSRPFRFRLPPAPYSFRGSLITLNWALELVAAGATEVARQEITIAPGGEAVRLDSLPQFKEKKSFFGSAS